MESSSTDRLVYIGLYKPLLLTENPGSTAIIRLFENGFLTLCALCMQIETMLHQMPSDMKKLQDLVSDILVLHSKGGDDNDIKNKFAVAQSLASKCKGWGDRVKVREVHCTYR